MCYKCTNPRRSHWPHHVIRDTHVVPVIILRQFSSLSFVNKCRIRCFLMCWISSYLLQMISIPPFDVLWLSYWMVVETFIPLNYDYCGVHLYTFGISQWPNHSTTVAPTLHKNIYMTSSYLFIVTTIINLNIRTYVTIAFSVYQQYNQSSVMRSSRTFGIFLLAIHNFPYNRIDQYCFPLQY